MNDKRQYGRSYFDEGTYGGYSNYSVSSVYKLYSLRTVLALKKVLNPSRVLDVGCAKGFGVLAFRKHGIEAYGIDISEYAVESSPREIRPYLQVLDINEEELPWHDGHFDLVVMSEVIEHLSDHNRALREIKRILSSQGYLYITTPSLGRVARKELTHINLHTRDEWLEIFSEHGFAEEKELQRQIQLQLLLIAPRILSNFSEFVRMTFHILYMMYSRILSEKPQLFLLRNVASS